MRLVAHLVRADVRRFRLLLAAWVLMEVLNTVFTGVRPLLAADPRTMTSIGLLAHGAVPHAMARDDPHRARSSCRPIRSSAATRSG